MYSMPLARPAAAAALATDMLMLMVMMAVLPALVQTSVFMGPCEDTGDYFLADTFPEKHRRPQAVRNRLRDKRTCFHIYGRCRSLITGQCHTAACR